MLFGVKLGSILSLLVFPAHLFVLSGGNNCLVLICFFSFLWNSLNPKSSATLLCLLRRWTTFDVNEFHLLELVSPRPASIQIEFSFYPWAQLSFGNPPLSISWDSLSLCCSECPVSYMSTFLGHSLIMKHIQLQLPEKLWVESQFLRPCMSHIFFYND